MQHHVETALGNGERTLEDEQRGSKRHDRDGTRARPDASVHVETSCRSFRIVWLMQTMCEVQPTALKTLQRSFSSATRRPLMCVVGLQCMHAARLKRSIGWNGRDLVAATFTVCRSAAQRAAVAFCVSVKVMS